MRKSLLLRGVSLWSVTSLQAVVADYERHHAELDGLVGA
jgi:hypothetical protein